MAKVNAKVVKVSSIVNEASLTTELNISKSSLAAIEAEMDSLDEQLDDLARQKEAIKANISDAESLKTLVARLKLRETEGIK